jgi:hypothetical protein
MAQTDTNLFRAARDFLLQHRRKVEEFREEDFF